MLNKRYILILGIIFLLSYHEINYAANTQISTTAPVSGAASLTFMTQSYTGLYPENVDIEEITTTSGIETEAHIAYKISNSIAISGFNTTKFYNGAINIEVTVNPGTGEGYITGSTLKYNAYPSEGLSMYVYEYTPRQYRILVMFDNYKPNGGYADAGQIITTFTGAISNPNDVGMQRDFRCTIAYQNGSVTASNGAINDRLSAIIYNAVEQSTFQDFDTIIGWLNSIYNDDLDKFNEIISILSSSNTFLSHIDTYTQNIYSKISNIDTNVGTILTDLESYITFMRQYIPYLSNISTNTLNTYNQLVTILEYMKNRPSLNYNLLNGYIYMNISTMQTQLTSIDENQYKHIVLRKEDMIDHIYLYVSTASWVQEIIYYDTYTEGQINIATRSYNANTTGEQYLPIDFKYNEQYAVININSNNETVRNNTKLYIGDGYTYSALMYYIQMMEKMNEEQSSIADEQNEEYATKENEAASVAAAAEITMPDISNISFDINNHIDQNTKSNWFTFLSMIVNNNYITTLLLICITAMIAGYILYGKKS